MSGKRQENPAVKAYLASHPGASTFDVAMCCCISDDSARFWIKRYR